MKQIEIYNRESNGERWRVVSCGNGLSYLLERTAHGETSSVFFQGDDAEIFRSEAMGDDGFFIDDAERVFSEYDSVMTIDSD